MLGARKRWLVSLVVLAAACGHGRSVQAGSDGGDGGSRPLPVLAAAAERRDIPITLEGLGSVTAYYTVTVHTLIDGQIMKVAFEEGQDVRKGDLLVQIDPRPYQVALEQAEAALARDQPQLDEAQRNLDRYAELLKGYLTSQQQVDDQRALAGQLTGTKTDRAAIDSAKLNLYPTAGSPLPSTAAPASGRSTRETSPTRLDATGLVILTQLDPIKPSSSRCPRTTCPRSPTRAAQRKLTADAR